MDMKRFCLQVLVGRWFMFFSSLVVMSTSGVIYMYGMYSGVIKTSLGYDQATLNLLSFFKDLGGNLGFYVGLIAEFIPPSGILLIGSIINFIGYFMIWLAVTGRIAKPSVWQMAIYLAIGAQSLSYNNLGSLVPSVTNFPQNRGSTLGLMKGFVGLSGAILTQLYHALYGDDSKALLLFLSWFPTIVPLIFIRTFRTLKAIPNATNEHQVLFKFLYASLSLAGFLMILIVLQTWFTFIRTWYVLGGSIVFALLLLPFVIVVKEEYNIFKIKTQDLDNNSSTEIKIVSKTEHSVLSCDTKEKEIKRVPFYSNVFKRPPRGEDHTILQALLSLDMLTLFVMVAFGMGGALTAIDNLGQIGSSLGYPTHGITTCVSLVSIWSYLGRVVAGFSSELLLTQHKVPRPLVYTIVLLISCIGYTLIAFPISYSLYAASMIIGLSFGAQFPLLFATISELFGLKHFAALYSFGGICSPIGSYVFNVIVTGRLYDKEALKQMRALGLTRKEGEELTCKGSICYRLSFIIMTLATLFGAFVSLTLVSRTRKFYKSDIYKKFRVESNNVVVDQDKITNNSGLISKEEAKS